MNALLLAPALALLSAPVSAAPFTDFIVDLNQGPGTDFTSIQEAVFAADDGDRIFVRTGTYESFVVRKGLHIQGIGSVRVSGPAQVLAVPAAERVVLAQMRLSELTVRTPSPIAVIGCRIDETVDVLQSPDVRFHRVRSLAPAQAPRFRDSTFELVECTFRGREGVDDPCLPEVGQPALRVEALGFGRVSRSTLVGGRGGDAPQISCFSSCADFLAPGGAAVELEGGGILLGGVTGDEILGGWSGSGASCFTEVQRAAVVAAGSFLRYSGVDINEVQVSQGTVITPPGRDVTLRLIGDAVPGTTIELEIAGQPGAFAEVTLGRGVLPLVIDPLSGVAPSVTAGRNVVLPAIPASGLLRVPLTIPDSYPQGTLLWIQALSEDSQGPAASMFSNSVPLLVR